MISKTQAYNASATYFYSPLSLWGDHGLVEVYICLSTLPLYIIRGFTIPVFTIESSKVSRFSLDITIFVEFWQLD